MKLAFCLFKYFPYGGLERNFLRAALLAQARGHEITVFSQGWEGDIPPGFKVNILPASRASNHARAAQFAQSLEHELARERFDVVVGFNKMPALDLYYAADRCFQHDVRQRYGALSKLNPRYRTFVALEEAVFSAASKTEIMLIHAPEQEIFQRYYGTPGHRFHLLPPGIARDRIAPANAAEIREQLRREFLLGPEDKLLLHIGSAFRGKGVDRILAAMASLPAALREKTRLIVLGNGKPAPLQRTARHFRVERQINILGGRNDVPRFLLGADLLVHPARIEAAGAVLLEAIVAGLPVLATDVCGFAHHVIRAEAGRIVASPFRQVEMNRLLNEMLTSSEQEKWRANGLDYARTQDLYSRPQKIVELIEAAAKRLKKNAPAND